MTMLWQPGREHCGKKAGFIFQFTMRTPPHCILGSTGREEPVEFEFLGPWCDHVGLKWLGAKNLSKTVKFRQKSRNFGGFLFLGVLKLDGRIWDLKIWILQVLPDL